MIDPGRSEDSHLRFGPRVIGALAGLAPAALVALVLLVTGTLTTRFDNAPVMGAIALGAVIVGWLSGPLVRGSLRPDFFALVVYAFLAAGVYLLVGSIQGALDGGYAGGAPVDLAVRLKRLAGQLAYGLLYSPFWALFVSPFALAWVAAARVLRRRWALAPAHLASLDEPRDSRGLGTVRPRRMVLLTAGVIVSYGLFVALLPLALYHDARPPWWYQRPVALFGLFGMPALVGAIGAVRGVRPLVVAAGVICLLQSYIAFSGVTIGFVIPAILLLVLGSSDSWPAADRVNRSAMLTGVAVIGLTIAAWVSLFALTEPRCWEGALAPDGSITIVEVPATQQQLYGPALVPAGGAGCGSAELTVQGMGVSAVLAVGALAVAAGTARASRRPDPA